MFTGVDSGHKTRVYVQGIEGEGPRPITAEGIAGALRCSPQGNLVSVRSQQQTWLVPVDGGSPRKAPGIGPDDIIVGWTTDGRALFVTGTREMPAKVFRVDIDSGKRQFMKQFSPGDSAGVGSIGPILVTPDLRYYSYGFARYLTDMYAVEGLK